MSNKEESRIRDYLSSSFTELLGKKKQKRKNLEGEKKGGGFKYS